MVENILNDKPLHVFIIVAETLTGWKNPNTEGAEVLKQHYLWATKLITNRSII